MGLIILVNLTHINGCNIIMFPFYINICIVGYVIIDGITSVNSLEDRCIKS